jgi:hypothetical protein
VSAAACCSSRTGLLGIVGSSLGRLGRQGRTRRAGCWLQRGANTGGIRNSRLLRAAYQLVSSKLQMTGDAITASPAYPAMARLQLSMGGGGANATESASIAFCMISSRLRSCAR